MNRLACALVLVTALTSANCPGQVAAELQESGSFAAPSMEILTPEEWGQIDLVAEAGLSWLATQQQQDGSFATDQLGQPGVTALCLLAFTARGHLPGDDQHGPTVAAAINYIASCQKPNGLLSSVGPAGEFTPRSVNGVIGTRAAYNHAIASLALSEAYGMTEKILAERIAASIPPSIQFSLKLQKRRKPQQRDQGGWRYLDYNSPPGSDLSVTGWYLMSLRSAKNAGFDVPEEPIKEAVEYVKRCYNADVGAFCYGGSQYWNRESRGMAAAGILALAHAGEHHSPQSFSSGDWLLRNPLPSYNRTHIFNDRYHYSAFYSCQAFYQLGGKYWAEGYPHIVKQLMDNQDRAGAWSADSHRHERAFGRTYTTSLAVLALSAPNQLLPIFQR